MKLRSVYFALAISLVFLVPQVVFAATLTVRSDLWPPYNGEPNTSNQGYMILVLGEIFKQHGYSVDYQALSWDESLDVVRKGASGDI